MENHVSINNGKEECNNKKKKIENLKDYKYEDNYTGKNLQQLKVSNLKI